MSTYEKVATIIIILLVLPMLFFSYREISERIHPEAGNPEATSSSSRFNESLGQDFKIGKFASITSQNTSGGLEANCDSIQPIIVGALHDIKEHLEHQKVYTGIEDAFEVNEATLQTFCYKNANITLSDASGTQLLLQKIPFTRVVPAGSGADDIGTEVHINATVIPSGGVSPAQPTTYGDVLIPDRFLDSTTSSLQ